MAASRQPGILVSALLAVWLIPASGAAAQSALQSLQQAERGCGARSLAAFVQLYRGSLTEEDVRSIAEGVGVAEVSMYNLAREAQRLGFDLVGARLSWQQLADLPSPAIVQLAVEGTGHFETIERVWEDFVRTADLGGLDILPVAWLRQRYTGHVLVPRQALLPSGQTDRPRGALAAYIHDFGLVGAGQRQEMRVRMTNHGEGDLVVSDVECPPNCRMPWQGPERIAPGQSAQWTVSFTPTLDGPPMRSGVITHLALIANDPLRPRCYLTLFADTMPPLDPDPMSIYLGRLGWGQAAGVSRTLHILCAPNEDLMTARLSASELQADVTRLEPDPLTGLRQYAVRVSFAASPQAGSFEAILFLHPKHAGNPVAVPVRAEIQPPLVVSPAGLFFGLVEPGARPRLTVDLIADPSRAVVVTRIESPKFIEAVFLPAADDRPARLEATLDSSDLSGAVEGAITLRTTLPGARSMRIPYHLHVTNGAAGKAAPR